MRTKSRPARPRRAISPERPPSPSPRRRRSPCVLLNQVDASAEDRADEVELNSSSVRVGRDLGSTDVDWLKGRTCIECNRGGVVLVCSELGCPIGVHAKCMQCKPKFDNLGNFYCPYCWYKRELSRTLELKKKVSLARKALSEFVNFKRVGGGDQVEQDEGSSKGNAQKVLSWIGERICSKYSSGMEVDEGRRKQFVQLEEDCQSGKDHAEVVEFGKCRAAVENEIDSLQVADDSEKVHHIEEEGIPGTEAIDDSFDKGNKNDENIAEQVEIEISVDEEEDGDDDDQDEGIVDDGVKAEPLSDHFVLEENNMDAHYVPQQHTSKEKAGIHKRKASPYADSPKKSSPQPHLSKKKNGNLETKPSSSKKSRKAQESAKKFTNLTFSTEKRRRLNWRPEEEEVLKEVVQKFANTINKNVPWRKILEFGRHVFDVTRTPNDLKDKWRNLMAKKSSHKLG